MPVKKPALGRGLDALFGARPAVAVAPPPDPAPVVQMTPVGPLPPSQENGVLRHIPIDQIQPNPFQPRTDFDQEKLVELADSIKEMGILQPIVLRGRVGFYEIVAGERRWRAAQLAGLRQVPAILKDFTDQQMTEAAIIENVQRDDLNPVDEARAYETLAEQFGLTQEAIAQSVGRSRVAITNSMRLLRLPEAVLEMLRQNRLSAGQARPLLALESAAAQIALGREIADKGLSARESEKKVKKLAKFKEGEASKGPTPAASGDIADYAERLSLHLGMQVKIHASSNTSGRIEVHYSTLDDFEKFCEQLGLAPSDL